MDGGGGALAEKKMIGTMNQVDWAEQIKAWVSAEFDRLSKALDPAARKQAEQKQMETLSVIAILGEKWAEVMAKDQAGYFVHEWQELRNQVRRMIAQDSRYQAIKANRGRDEDEGVGPFSFEAEKAERAWRSLIHVRDELGDFCSNLIQTYAGGDPSGGSENA